MPEKLRAAAYCRVSTDKEEQRSSLEAQRSFFQSYIARQGWELVDILAEEGLSGTSIARRPQFARLLSMAFGGEVDLIVTKEVSRFARNTVDALKVTRELRERGVGVLFLNDGIDTRDSDGEFRLTIMASVAQEESRKISQRTRWGQAQAMKRGVVFGNNSIFGYTLQGGVLTVQPEQAEVVRLIYRKYLSEGKGTSVIARELTEAGISPPLRPEGSWSPTMVLRILRNEKYCGDLLQQKSRTVDHLSHRKVRNDGTVPQLLIEGHHEGIVSPEEFRRVREELARRRELAGEGRHFSARYWYSGKVLCGACGRTMTGKRTRRAGGKEYLCFVCRGRLGTAASPEERCTMRGVSGAVLEVCAHHVLKELGLDWRALLDRLLSAPQELRREDREAERQQAERALQRQEARRRRGLEAYLDGTLRREEWQVLSARCEARRQALTAQLAHQRKGAERRTGETLPDRAAELRRGTEAGTWVLEEAVERITVEEDCLLVRLREFPVPFRVRAERRGRGRGYRITVTECVPLPADGR